MHVKVLDENDNSPRFVGDLTDGDTITVPKTSSRNNVIGRVKAQDTDSSDNTKLTYRLLNGLLRISLMHQIIIGTFQTLNCHLSSIIGRARFN